MHYVNKILENENVLFYLKARGLINQYKKAKSFLEAHYYSKVSFKERQPKGVGVYYFRINRQYRAICTLNKEGVLLVFKIDNHQ